MTDTIGRASDDRSAPSCFEGIAAMASTPPPSAKEIEILGIERMAELLAEYGGNGTTLGNRVQMELAAARGDMSDLKREALRRLDDFRDDDSLAEWDNALELAHDLDTLRRGIIEIGAKGHHGDAFDLMWRFMDLTEWAIARGTEDGDDVGNVFRDACRDIGALALNVGIDPEMLADRICDALLANNYGQFDPLVSAAAAAMGQTGLEHLKRRMAELWRPPVEPPAEGSRTPARGTGFGPLQEDRSDKNRWKWIARDALREIADAQGDVDAFATLYDDEERKTPKVAVEIARRLLNAGRGDEALRTLDTAERTQDRRWQWWFDRPDWVDLKIDILYALGRDEATQDIRWNCFQSSLSETHLRAYLKRLTGSEKADAEAKALDHAMAFPNRLQALDFLISWPALDHAAALVVKHAAKLDGYGEWSLTSAASALAARHPLAATLALRAMIDVVLKDARSRRYADAARNLRRCARLAPAIADFAGFETHQDYVARLRREHARKSSFWPRMGSVPDSG